MIFVSFNIFAFWLVQIDTDIRGEWWEWNCLSVDAGISSRFEHAGGESGVQHTRRFRCGRNFQHDICFSFCIQCAVKYICFDSREIRSRIVKDILSVILKLCIHFR